MANPTRAQCLAQLTAPGELYELAEGMVNGRPSRFFVNAPINLHALFESTLSDLPFMIYEDSRETFRSMYLKSAALSHALIDRCGIVPGDRVAIAMRNYPEWVMAYTAITSIGAVAVALNALWQSEEIAYGLSHAGVQWVIADDERVVRIHEAKLPGVQCIAVRSQSNHTNTVPFEDLLEGFRGQSMPAADVGPDDPATIFFTSGSTGFPKGAVSSHRNIISALFSWELDLVARQLELGVASEPPAHQPGTLLAVPLFHTTGSNAVYLQSYRAQRKLVSMYRWDPAEAARLIERESITSFVAPAAMTGDLIQHAQQAGIDLSSLVSVGGGGAPRAPAQVRSIQKTFKAALPSTGWGMTETNAIGTGIGGEDYLARPESSGRASAVLDLKIVGDHGQALPPKTPGELWVRGASVIINYWNRPDANAESFSGDWLKTGDIAYLDDEGYLYIVDRMKDLVIRGGENIGCAEVEAALLMHPGVLEASVYSLPDERLGEEVGATLYTQRAISEGDLRTFLMDHLAKFKIPRYFIMTTQPLLRIASGKIDKRLIRASAAQTHGLDD